MEVWMEFDIHGSVGIRVEGATDVDGAALVYQLGPPQPLHGREPDITIRFQDRLERPDLVYLGLNEMAFDHSGFYVLGRRDGMIKARIPFEAIGQPCDILCRRGIGDIPLLYDHHVHVAGKGILACAWCGLPLSREGHSSCGLDQGWKDGITTLLCESRC